MMPPTRNFYRKGINLLMTTACSTAAAVALIPLFLILFHLFSKGFASLDWNFFTQLPKPVGEPGGGMANAIAGSFFMMFLACGIGLPFGILGGVYLAEFGRGKRASLVRFTADILSGTPSIVIGMFAYVLIVLPMKRFSALAGGVALGIIMIPTILRTTEEMIHLVPVSLREGSLALGISRWRTLISIVLKTARAGILTGILLAIARIAGETAPLLFTALGNQFWSLKLLEPVAALPLQIYTFAISPFQEWQTFAWAGALFLILSILCLNILSRVFMRGRHFTRL